MSTINNSIPDTELHRYTFDQMHEVRLSNLPDGFSYTQGFARDQSGNKTHLQVRLHTRAEDGWISYGDLIILPFTQSHEKWQLVRHGLLGRSRAVYTHLDWNELERRVQKWLPRALRELGWEGNACRS